MIDFVNIIEDYIKCSQCAVHQLAAALNIVNAVLRLTDCIFYEHINLRNQIFNIMYRIGTGLRKLSNLCRHHRKTFSRVSCPGRFDGCI